MYSLACRLAKTENILETFGPADKQLEKKRDKLKSQLEEAKYLNKLIQLLLFSLTLDNFNQWSSKHRNRIVLWKYTRPYTNLCVNIST